MKFSSKFLLQKHYRTGNPQLKTHIFLVKSFRTVQAANMVELQTRWNHFCSDGEHLCENIPAAASLSSQPLFDAPDVSVAAQLQIFLRRILYRKSLSKDSGAAPVYSSLPVASKFRPYFTKLIVLCMSPLCSARLNIYFSVLFFLQSPNFQFSSSSHLFC